MKIYSKTSLILLILFLQISQSAILLHDNWSKSPRKLKEKRKEKKLSQKKTNSSKGKSLSLKKTKLAHSAKKSKKENRKSKQQHKKTNNKITKERKLAQKNSLKKFKASKGNKSSKKSSKPLKSSSQKKHSPIKERRLSDHSFENKLKPKTPFRKLSDDKSANEKSCKVWEHDPKSIKKLENYAITSLMTLISLKVAQDANPKNKPASLAKTSRKLGLIGNFVKGKSMTESFEKQKKDLAKYLKVKRIPVKKNIATHDMERIMKKYVHDRFRISPKKFEVVRELITGLYKVGQKLHKKKV